MTLEQEIERLKKLVPQLTARIAELEEENARLRGIKKDSSNSSIPPSQDPFRVKRTESLRNTSGKKIGGQQGHEGTTLQMVVNPTKTIEHQPVYCSNCGNDLSHISGHLSGRCQLIDIPPIVPIVTEHRIYSKKCSCGHCQQENYLPNVHSSLCYGENIISMSAYMHARQYVPYDRMQEMFENVFGLKISTGSLVNMVSGFAAKAFVTYEQIRLRITKSPVVGGDETSVWKPYFTTTVAGHQICLARLLRELKYLDKLYGDDWIASFRKLLYEALDLKKELLVSDYLYPIEQRKQLEQRFEQLLQSKINEEQRQLVTFKNRMEKYKEHLFLFLYYHDVPPDNNGSERAVRTFKVKQKVSGLFRCLNGAEAFVIIKSVIDTTIKNFQNVFNALACIAKFAGE